jgi:DNA-binding transcriptional LysR family regulator
MNLQHIKYFLELSRELHFWNTSEKMFITQSALSRHIKALEEELGFPLFERNKRSVKLTIAGEFLKNEWERLIVQIENLHQNALQIHEGEYGNLRIGHPVSIIHSVLPEITTKFIAKFPNLKLEFIEMKTIDLEISLLNFQVDIGFRREVSMNNLLETKTLFAEKFAIVVPANHPIKAKKLNDISDFKDEKFILPSLIGGSRYTKILRKIFKDADFTPKVNLISEFGTAILSFVAEGIGISVLPISYAKDASDKVRFIEIPYNSYLYVQWRKGENNQIVDHFVKNLDEITFPNFTPD